MFRVSACRVLAIVALSSAAMLPVACASRAQTGAVAGAGIGALMGQAIGGNTTATLIGTGVGVGVGYIIGNEMDRSQAQELSRNQDRQIRELEQRQQAQQAELDRQRDARASAPPPPPPPAPRSTPGVVHTEVGSLGDTRWRVVSINPSDAVPEFASFVVDFRSNGRVLTTRTNRDGTIVSGNESFRVVGDTLIINETGYIINARFQQTASQLFLSADRFSAVLERLPG